MDSVNLLFDISISIVSHGQGALIANLLNDLARDEWHDGLSFEVIVTINIPEDERWLPLSPPFPLTVIRNEAAKGFGANHNSAFRVTRGRFFAVVNPDIRLANFHAGNLIAAFADPKAGVCGPKVLAPSGSLEDSARYFPTVLGLAKRRLSSRKGADYRPDEVMLPVDWLAGMFLLFLSQVYRTVGGFDERYFMYLEDVEISRHLNRCGFKSIWVGTTAVIHDASRASRRSLRHMRYHAMSALRYFLGRARVVPSAYRQSGTGSGA